MKGAGANYFLGGIKKSAYRCVNRPPCGKQTALFDGTITDYINASGNGGKSKTMLLNNVKVCPKCAKPNGYTLCMCNQCRTDISDVPLTTSPNLFSAFLLGIARTEKFDLKLSFRAESEEVLVFDDPLALSPLHFCAIPAKHFIPDWRYLTLFPESGLQLCKLLENSCLAAAQESFFADKVWNKVVLNDAHVSPNDFLTGFNFPPSQNQLHIQFMLPVLMPHQYMLFLRGIHFTHQRFFPLGFVVESLTKLCEKKVKVPAEHLNLPIDAFIVKLRELSGVDYDTYHSNFMQNADRLYSKYAFWPKEKFTYEYTLTKEEQLERKHLESGQCETTDEKAVFEAEKRVLQNYGKGEPSPLTYYSFPKAIDKMDFSYMESVV
ncbi:hypothetical protein AGDE_05225 [Angomonas deanei]|uniref:Scavenger mRNA decapping enzyme C-term binding, putative n=1 Tax=Angomonas deanei TaxID=59799 RepID=A0A7G2C2K2_9TRYP|nr:hypothetical protein AGDE_05225 [Angomonas deanei]CAD2213474.1 Scavenger mRNA decapping enzyme C-term binding, putative [Angomonas deanei]|eukprot:EPY38704.1 hypothetical protein AGDE_05225 [Angomonas deanei]